MGEEFKTTAVILGVKDTAFLDKKVRVNVAHRKSRSALIRHLIKKAKKSPKLLD